MRSPPPRISHRDRHNRSPLIRPSPMSSSSSLPPRRRNTRTPKLRPPLRPRSTSTHWRCRRDVLQKYKWKRTSASHDEWLRSTSSQPLSMGSRDTARTRGRPSQALSTRTGTSERRSERASARARSHGRPLYHFRYRAPRGSRFTVLAGC